MNSEISDRLLSRLADAERVVVFTGAGVSAESGVPTFRGTDGIWKKFKPEELASMDAFMKNPDLVWEWYAHRERVISTIQPNPGHYALVTMEQMFSHFALITQNIDNLHRRAGSRAVYELHGNIERNYCMKCGTRYSCEQLLGSTHAPTCVRCGGLVRPDVVWFGEMLPEEEWDASVRLAEAADVFLSVGTSAIVYPAASLPMMAKLQGAFLAEINPEPTLLTDRADEFLQGLSGAILPALVERLPARRAAHGSTRSQS